MGRKIGAEFQGDGKTKFVVWAPFKDKMEVIFKNGTSESLQRTSRGILGSRNKKCNTWNII
jgi:1,4-alpha-glucan branching enzyme